MTNELILAGLLHDIGKFMQRAHEGLGVLSQQSRNMENMLCPVKDGRHTHYHTLFTNEFCEKHLDHLPDSMDRSLVMNLASYHHKPSDASQMLIQEADRLSSGIECYEDDSPEGPQHFSNFRLRAIASRIDIGKGTDTLQWSHKLKPLTPDDAFPNKNLPQEKTLTDEYLELWNAFLEQWSQNRVQDAWGFINRALSILEWYTWCIPSETDIPTDISLFDHAKTTAAIAACLYSSPDKDKPFLLLAGDFSGIQQYIFDIKKGKGGYAKRLRARSYYVSLLSEAVSLKILRKLSLPLTQRILFAGGKFHLLLPNTQDTQENVCVADEIRVEIDNWLLDRTDGDIRFSLVHHATGKEGILRFAETLTLLNQRLREEKETPYRSILHDGTTWNTARFKGEAIHTDGEKGVCEACGKRQGIAWIFLNKDEKIWGCDSCGLDFHMGTKLPKSEYISFSEKGTGRGIVPKISIELFREYPRGDGTDAFLIKNFSGTVDAPGELPFMSSFAVNHIPREDDEPLDFDAIGKKADGLPRIAYLKGDVDSLGLIFSQGLSGAEGETDKVSISRIATLSRTLEIFFSGHFRYLLENDDRFRYIYTVYAGGDDFLCLGPWNTMIKFAQQMREDFRKFTGENPNWSMSMGLALAGNHTPVLEGADAAEEHLDISKRITGGDMVPVDRTKEHLEVSKRITGNYVVPIEACVDGKEPSKDRISLFGTSIPFQNLPEAYKKAQEVALWLVSEEQTLSSSHIWRLRRYGELYRQWVLTKNTRFLEYVPLIAYDLRRNWNWEKEGLTPKRKNAKEWAASLGVAPDMPDMKILKFICEYSLLMNRGKEED